MIKLPYIFIIDFYYLLLCDTTYLDKEIELSKLLNEKCNINIINEFTDKELIIRPDFKLFIDFLKSNYKHAEIFVYIAPELYKYFTNSNSIDEYIDKFENINKLKLTSMNNYYDIIIENLKLKYPSLNKNKLKVFDSQLTIFTEVNNIFFKFNKTIKSPSYNYKYYYYIYYDIYDKIINTYKINPNTFDNPEVLKFCEKNEIPVHNKNGSLYQKDLLYQNILKLYHYKIYKLSDNSNKEDTFFKDYINEIKNNT